MKVLSTGQDSTLENYISLSTSLFGSESPAVKFLIQKAKDSPNGVKEEVLVDETQMVLLLFQLNETTSMAV